MRLRGVYGQGFRVVWGSDERAIGVEEFMRKGFMLFWGGSGMAFGSLGIRAWVLKDVTFRAFRCNKKRRLFHRRFKSKTRMSYLRM